MITENAILDALKIVKDPDLHQAIVALGFVKKMRIDGDRVAFAIELTTPACPVKEQMRDQAHAAVMALPGVKAVDVELTASVRSLDAGERHNRGMRLVAHLLFDRTRGSRELDRERHAIAINPHFLDESQRDDGLVQIRILDDFQSIEDGVFSDHDN